MKTGREQGKGSFAFLEVNDGSCAANLQVIVDAAVADLGQLVLTGTSVSVEGLLKNPPEGTKQKIELRVEKVIDVGTVDPAKYPIPKTKLTLEFLRDRIHFRPRTNTVFILTPILRSVSRVFVLLLKKLIISIFFLFVHVFRLLQLRESEMLLLMLPTRSFKSMGFYTYILQLSPQVIVKVLVRCFKLQL